MSLTGNSQVHELDSYADERHGFTGRKKSNFGEFNLKLEKEIQTSITTNGHTLRKNLNYCSKEVYEIYFHKKFQHNNYFFQ